MSGYLHVGTVEYGIDDYDGECKVTITPSGAVALGIDAYADPHRKAALLSQEQAEKLSEMLTSAAGKSLEVARINMEANATRQSKLDALKEAP